MQAVVAGVGSSDGSNAKLIARSRTLLPRALDEIDHLEKVVNAAKARQRAASAYIAAPVESASRLLDELRIADDDMAAAIAELDR